MNVTSKSTDTTSYSSIDTSISLGNKPALIIVDAIKGFTDPACPLGHDCDAAVAKIQDLVEAFRQHGHLIVFTTVVYDTDDQASVFRAKLPALNVLQRGEPWPELDDRLEFKTGDLLIEKHWASAFHGTTLNTQLKQRGIDSLVVTGFTTSGCVRATAVDGLQNNYPVVVAEDACSDRTPDAHVANLFDLKAKYTTVEKTEVVLREISGQLKSLG